jgi:hypothetical protein
MPCAELSVAMLEDWVLCVSLDISEERRGMDEVGGVA